MFSQKIIVSAAILLIAMGGFGFLYYDKAQEIKICEQAIGQDKALSEIRDNRASLVDDNLAQEEKRTDAEIAAEVAKYTPEEINKIKNRGLTPEEYARAMKALAQ